MDDFMKLAKKRVLELTDENLALLDRCAKLRYHLEICRNTLCKMCGAYDSETNTPCDRCYWNIHESWTEL